LNDGRGTYVDAPNKLTCLDLSLVSSNFGLSSTWSRNSSTMGSDHFPINIKLSCHSTILEPQYISKYILRKADWSAFTASLTGFLKIYTVDPANEDVDHSYSDFVDAITMAADIAIPKTKPCITKRQRTVPFWHETLKIAIKTRDDALEKAFKYKHDIHCCTEFYKLKHETKITVENEEQIYWQNYCDSLTDTTRLTSVWRTSKAMNGQNTTSNLPSFDIDGTEYNNNKAMAALFAERFSAISAKSNHTPEFIKLSTFQENAWKKQTSKAKTKSNERDEPFELHELHTPWADPNAARLSETTVYHMKSCNSSYFNNT